MTQKRSLVAGQQSFLHPRQIRAQGPLQSATAPDASVVWAYPYDGTVWPRGLLSPNLQWNGGAATDDYYVHIVSSTFELQDFAVSTGAPRKTPSRSASSHSARGHIL